MCPYHSGGQEGDTQSRLVAEGACRQGTRLSARRCKAELRPQNGSTRQCEIVGVRGRWEHADAWSVIVRAKEARYDQRRGGLVIVVPMVRENWS